MLSWLLALTLVLDSCPRDSVLDEYHPPQYRPAVQLLEYLRRQQPGTMTGSEAATKGRIPDVDSVLAYIAPEGLTMTDVVDSAVHRYTMVTLRAALRHRGSHAFGMFTHLGYIRDQERGLTYRPLPSGGVLVCVDDWYRLTFVSANQRLYLRRLDYVMDESE